MAEEQTIINLGWLKFTVVVGQFAQPNPESRTWLQKTSYEFILWWGGGVGIMAVGPSFLLSFLQTSPLSLFFPPAKPKPAEKV